VATISGDIIASYAADAASEIPGVAGLVEGTLPRHKGVRVLEEEGGVRIELHVRVEWGASIPAVGAAIQERVAAYLGRMTETRLQAVDVVVDEIGPNRPAD
jgi:uncharacterized alkaline shock family protein YloU